MKKIIYLAVMFLFLTTLCYAAGLTDTLDFGKKVLKEASEMIKNQETASQEKGDNLSRDSQATPDKVEPSTELKKSLESTSVINDNGNFNVDPSSLPIQNKPFAVFDIPLNASVQDVVNVLEKKGVEFNGYEDENKSDYYFNEQLIDRVTRLYEVRGITGERKDAAIKVIKDKKIKIFKFQYRNRPCWLVPQSLAFLLRGERGITPMFEKLYPDYNSQFYLESQYRLSEDLQYIGLRSLGVLFTSENQADPRSTLISLYYVPTLVNNELIGILSKKYGLPKMYYAEVIKDKHREDLACTQILDDLKQKFPNHEEKKHNYVLYDSIIQYFALTNSLAFRKIANPFEIYQTGSGYDWNVVKVTLEWNTDDVKIVGSFAFSCYKNPSVSPISIVYMLYQPLSRVTDKMRNIFESSQKESQQLKEKSILGY